MAQPEVGDVVLYHTPDGQEQALIVQEVQARVVPGGFITSADTGEITENVAPDGVAYDVRLEGSETFIRQGNSPDEWEPLTEAAEAPSVVAEAESPAAPEATPEAAVPETPEVPSEPSEPAEAEPAAEAEASSDATTTTEADE